MPSFAVLKKNSHSNTRSLPIYNAGSSLYHPAPLQGLQPAAEYIRRRMEEGSGTKDVCNAIRKNKGLFNEEARTPSDAHPANPIVSLF